ncbi:MAG: VWA domain-containing protein, partial [Thermoplasmata archaeon]|nr:VWA domain-containing protein [Thermoplasmata archaeon]
FVETAGPEFPTQSTITLSISGIGSSIEWSMPQDVIFLIDQSWSIGDAFSLERHVALNYLDDLKRPDMAAVIYFEWFPQPRRPLTSNYEQVRLDILAERRASEWEEVIPPCSPPDDPMPSRPCFTRLGKAIEGALREFEMNGNKSHMQVILLLTDGWHNDWYSKPDWILDPRIAATYAKENGTRIYTLGISGRDGMNVGILREMANISGGEYMRIDDQHDFDGMYENISHFVDDTAARDPDLFDSIPMIEDFLPWYVHCIPGSFVDPATGDPRPPDVLISNPSGSEFKWFNRVLRVGETWSVSFNVTVAITGLISADIYPDSGVNYASWNWTNVSVPFPITTILVLPPIHPPTNVTASLEGSNWANVRIYWIPSLDDPAIVDHYDVYFGTAYHPDGGGYSLLASVPKGSDSALHVGGGEGNPQDYFYRVCAVTASGGSVCSPSQAGKFTRSLASGPSLVSIPLIQSNESIEHVLQTVEYDKAWYYDSFDQEWRWHMPFKAYRRGLWNINHTMGLWVNFTADSHLTVAGIVPVQTSIQLFKGWNLVSFPSFNTSYTVADLKAETGATRVEGLETMPPFPPSRLRVLGDAEVLLAGLGYWVKVEADTVWTVEVS